MVGLETINNFMSIKEAFGSFAILDNAEPEDLTPLIEFAVIVSNYKKMKSIGSIKETVTPSHNGYRINAYSRFCHKADKQAK